MNVKVKGIARYPRVMKPSDYQGDGKFRFTVYLLIHKNDPACLEIENQVNETVQNTFPKGTPSNFKNCWKDLAETESQNEALKDYMSLTLSTNADQNKPVVVDADRKPVIDPSLDAQLAGQIIWVSGGLSCYTKGSNGIKCYLNGVLVTGQFGDIPRESISSKPSVDQMFADVDVTSPSTPPAPPAPSLSKHEMTAKANGLSRDSFISEGWTDEQLIKEGLMLPPNGVTPSFVN